VGSAHHFRAGVQSTPYLFIHIGKSGSLGPFFSGSRNWRDIVRRGRYFAFLKVCRRWLESKIVPG
jgi:hypothetical protein